MTIRLSMDVDIPTTARDAKKRHRSALPLGRTPAGMTTHDVRALAESIAEHGFSVEVGAQAALWAGARRRGVSPVLVSIAADPTEQEVVRFRALAKVVSRYCALVAADEIDLAPGRADGAAPVSSPSVAMA